MARWVEKRKKERRDELLSAYLDGQLSAEARARLEAQLATDPALHAELEALRRTVALVRDLPRVSAPRNFILPQAAATRPRSVPLHVRRSLAPWLTAATSVAALLFIAILLSDLITSASGRAFAPTAPLYVEEQETVAITEVEQGTWATAPAASPLAMVATTEEESTGKEEQQDMMAAPAVLPSPVPDSPAAEEGGLAPAATPGPTETERVAGVLSPTPVPEIPKYVDVTAPPIPMAEAVPSEAAQEETALTEPERAPASVRGGPPSHPTLRIIEIGLGLIVLILGSITVWAWRAR